MSRNYIDRAMGSYKKPRSIRDGAVRRFLLVISLTLSGVLLLLFLVTMNYSSTELYHENTVEIIDVTTGVIFNISDSTESIKLPKHNYVSRMLEKKNKLPPRNVDLYPNLAKDRIIIVLYVHNRPQYLKLVVDSLSRVSGINETLLIVSHDGYFEEMNKIIEGIEFCQVKQVFAPFSPHIFPNRFPGVSPNDCKEKDDPIAKNCEGTTDQYGNHRAPKIVSLKHHWWWMMNTIWDGLQETISHSGDILFIEEDHFIFPNAYENLKVLTDLKPSKCPDCYAVNLAPSNVKSRGEGWDTLIAERMGNIGYTFNRTVWRKIHRKAKEFCFFDDYNWDITMWVTVYPSFGGPVYSMRGPRASAVHFGKCGLHQGQGEQAACVDNGVVKIESEEIDKVVNVKAEWGVHVFRNQEGYQAGFRGWGGWGDKRDHQLCLDFAKMYHLRIKKSS